MCRQNCVVCLIVGNYSRFDMNMPKSLPQRKGSPQSFVDDSPLTVQGLFQAKLLGKLNKSNSLSLIAFLCFKDDFAAHQSKTFMLKGVILILLFYLFWLWHILSDKTVYNDA